MCVFVARSRMDWSAMRSILIRHFDRLLVCAVVLVFVEEGGCTCGYLNECVEFFVGGDEGIYLLS
jgi:hypothetical protein